MFGIVPLLIALFAIAIIVIINGIIEEIRDLKKPVKDKTEVTASIIAIGILAFRTLLWMLFHF